MTNKVLDFERTAMCYKPYVDAVTVLEGKSNELRTELTKMQEEAMGYMKMDPEVTIDEATQHENQEKFQKIQQEAMLKDKAFKVEAEEEQRRIIMMSYDGISNLVKEYVSNNKDIELVLNRSEVVYFSPDNDLTQSIIDMMKEQDLYTDERLNDIKE